MKQFKISVILPTLNEAQNIVALIERIWAALPYVYEIIVVDDNSPDGTAGIVQEFAVKFTRCPVRVEKRMSDHGLTKSIWHGIMQSRGDVVVWMDCDLSMPPEVLPELILGLGHGYDISVGSRFVKGGSFKRGTIRTQDSAVAVALSRMMNYAIQFFLDYSFKDYTSGFVAARRRIFDDICLRGDYGEYFIDFMFRAIRRGYKIIEIPYVCLPRHSGVSKTGSTLRQLCSRGWGYIRIAVTVRWKVYCESRSMPKKRENGEITELSDGGDVVIAPLSNKHLPFVAGLHHTLLPDTVNSRLGTPFLHDLYGGVLEDPRSRCWVALAGDNIIGFISATTDAKRTKGLLGAKMLKRDKIVALLHIVTHPLDLLAFLKQQIFFNYCTRRAAQFPTILTLAVAIPFQGKQVAQRLVEAAHDFYKAQGVRRYFVDTFEVNQRAIAFYRKVGFERVGSSMGNALLARAT